YPQQVLFSYYQASLVCELIARDWGEKALVGLLQAYRGGLDTEQAMRRVLRIDQSALDKRFDAYMRERFGAVLPVLVTYGQQVDSARALLDQGSASATAAIGLLERARASFPEYAGAQGAYPLLARALLARGDRKRAAEVLGTMLTLGEASHD